MTKMDEWVTNNKCINNEKSYDAFIKQFNDPFDGKASERIINLLSA